MSTKHITEETEVEKDRVVVSDVSEDGLSYTLTLPFQSHSATSKGAAEKATSTAQQMRWCVWCLLREAGENGLTDDELLEAVRKEVPYATANSVRPRRVELSQTDYVFPSQKTRRSASGVPATVWVAYDGDSAGALLWANLDDAVREAKAKRKSRKKLEAQLKRATAILERVLYLCACGGHTPCGKQEHQAAMELLREINGAPEDG